MMKKHGIQDPSTFTGMERVAARIGDGGLDVGFYLSNTDSLHARANRLFSQSLAQVNRRVLEANDVDCIMDGEMPVEELGIPFEEIPEQMSATVGTEYGEFVGAMHLVSNVGGNSDVYYYHGDHLGSASWITDASGTAVQHLQYLPFGERFVDQRTSGYCERFTFTGKERDEETGYGYFGARYMDYELMTMWLSVDPMADKYPGISPYAYCVWNPVKLVDPNGMEIDLSAIYDNNGKSRKGCESFCKVFDFFARTSIGQKYLARYAKKGQIIAGHEYKEDGVYHKKGIDLQIEYGVTQYYPDNRSGYTDANSIVNGRLKLKIHILPETTDKDSKAKLLEAFCHEFFIHAIQYADKFSPKQSQIWKTQKSDAYNQHMADIKTKHLMRDCAVPILTKYCDGDRQRAIDIISQETNYKKNPSWYKK